MKWSASKWLFKTHDHKLPLGCTSYAQSPQALGFETFIRIYFSSRVWHGDIAQYESRICYVDYDIALEKPLGMNKEAVIALGGLGCFDEHGIFPFSPFIHQGRIMAYTCGWSRRKSVPVETSTGLAESFDGGRTFIKLGNGPVLSSSMKEPVLVGDSFVRYFNNQFHMWYIFGLPWKYDGSEESAVRVYKIAHAVSDDGVHWEKEEGVPIIPNRIGDDECQALPTVIKIGNRFHMVFCYRYATDFRTNDQRGYRLGYAYSDDLINWTRAEETTNLESGWQGWDDKMQCYPNLFEHKGAIYLLYNGNEFGKFGFGYRKLLHI